MASIREADGGPAAAAEVILQCPHPRLAEENHLLCDADGRLRVKGLGCLHRDCPVRIEHRGVAVVRHLGDFCVGKSALGCRSDVACNRAEINVMLPPENGTQGPPRD